MAESETDCDTPGLDTLGSECVIAHTQVGDLHYGAETEIMTQEDKRLDLEAIHGDLGAVTCVDVVTETDHDYIKSEIHHDHHQYFSSAEIKGNEHLLGEVLLKTEIGGGEHIVKVESDHGGELTVESENGVIIHEAHGLQCSECVLDLSRCHIKLIENDTFYNVKNLTTLILTGNPITYFGPRCLNTLHNLQRLVLVDVGLSSLQLPVNNLTKLQELRVGTNTIQSMSLPPFMSTFKDFSLLDLHANNISIIKTNDTFVFQEIGRNMTLILSRNPLSFIEPGAFKDIYLRKVDIRSAFVSSAAQKAGLRALYGLNVKQLMFGKYKGDFKFQFSDADALDGLCSIHFQEIYYYISERPSEQSFIFRCMINATNVLVKDGVIDEMDYDEVWVMNELMENLENGVPPIQLCLHMRDFQAGKSIASNIIDEGIMGSRKIIVVVSQHFIDSAWCRFEFELAQSRFILERNANIIIIILEDVEERNTKKVFGLHKHLKKNTYLKWSRDPLSNMRFWRSLRKAIISTNQ
ncbi:hypothetical protein QQF64_005987 [Cirrhinus molitorella]|uniref:Toll-like receptor 4 n=1 Tax=Cirrhinus molitorella TaxID=172907 RepID=A0ABR3MDT9_9TELE